MAKKKELKDIAYGIGSSFISRNNDVDGYWAIGVLHKIVRESGMNSFHLDFLKMNSSPKINFIEDMVSSYIDYVKREIKKRKLSEIIILSIYLDIKFDLSFEGHSILLENALYQRGRPFECCVSILDENQKIYRSKLMGTCEPHDPSKDFRSIRR